MELFHCSGVCAQVNAGLLASCRIRRLQEWRVRRDSQTELSNFLDKIKRVLMTAVIVVFGLSLAISIKIFAGLMLRTIIAPFVWLWHVVSR